jgi:hypothetical protein
MRMLLYLLSIFFGESKVFKVVLKTFHCNAVALFLHVCVKCFIFDIEILIDKSSKDAL